MSNQILISFIVPVYNVEDYLEDCIESLNSQNLNPDKFEIICVNDGSTDDSLDKLNSLKDVYPSIIVVNQENQGVSVARNNGLKIAQGKWVMFVDPDDYLESGYMNKILDAMESECVEIASVKFRSVSEESHFSASGIKSIDYQVGINKPFYCGNVVLFIFLREFIVNNRLHFEKRLKYSEDEMFLFDVCCCMDLKKYIGLSNVIYNYRIRKGSALRQPMQERLKRHTEDMVTAAEIIDNRLKDGTVPEIMKNGAIERRNQAVSNALYDNARLSGNPEVLISELERRGLYPYKLPMQLLKPRKSIKTMAVNYSKFLFPCKAYYRMFCKVVRVINN